jgi:1,4-alpha-glucan branching enzyme
VPGDEWRKLATLRAYFAFMWTHPGKKLLFMGGELGVPSEWNHDGEIAWRLLQDPPHAGLQRLVGDLNRLYAREPALHAGDCDPNGFRWLIGNDFQNSVFAYERGTRNGETVVVVVNMTPLPRQDYRIGVDKAGTWREVINTDSSSYGGGNVGNTGRVTAQARPSHGHPQSLGLVLPPLATLILAHEV